MPEEFINPYTGSKLFGGPENIIPYLIKEIFEDLCYETGIDKFDTIIDLGANIGVAADFFQSKANKIICVEPINENYENLQLFAKTNRFEHVLCEKYAIWSSSDREFSFAQGNDKTNCHISGRTINGSNGHNATTSITIKDLMELYDLEKVDLIKMDIEGSEVEVMTNPNFKEVVGKSPNWLIEIHNHEYHNLVPIMEKFGFKHKVLSGFDLVNPVVHFYA